MPYRQTLSALSAMLERGEISSVELIQCFLDRIDRSQELNAFITVDAEGALTQAQSADRSRANGHAGALTGLPIAHKDIFCSRGLKTTCGSRMLEDFVSPYDATIVERLADTGTVLVGKTNMDEFAMGSSNENSFYGPVKNPWNKKMVPGGSSGGSAAAVAGRLSPFATGTDTGGSIRQPSSLCGITGIKPTYGRVSRYGMIAYASSLDQAGPMTQTAEDAALVLNAIAGFDEKDSTSALRDVPDYTKSLRDSIKGLKIGIPKEFFSDGLDSSVEKVITESMKEFEAMGAELQQISLPNSAYAIPTYYIVAPCECSSNLSRLDGVRYGYRCKDPKDLNDLYLRSRSEGFGDEVKRRIMIGTYALSAGYYDAYYLKAQKVRQLISEDFKKAFQDVDIIMGPVSPTTAFELGAIKDSVSMYLADIYTLSANLAGLPGMSIPAGFSNNLPVGLQMIGNYWSEEVLLNAAHQFQTQTDWHSVLPENI